MRTVPKKRLERVQYFEDHIAPFTTNAAAIGLLPADVTDLSTKTTAARAAYNAQQTAIQAAQTATTSFYNAWNAMRLSGDGALEKIRNKALVTGNPNVYTLAQVAPPAPPTPAGDPGTPFGFKVELTSTGALKCKWKNSNATYATYQVYRRLGDTGAFEFFAGVGQKKFTDTTVPAGTAMIQYQMQAVRSTGVSEWATFTVNLGNSLTSVPAITATTSPTRIAA